MVQYVGKMLEEFPIKFTNKNKKITPAGNTMFSDDNSKKLNQEGQEIFHQTTAQGSFMAKQGKPDILPNTYYICVMHMCEEGRMQ